MAQVQQPTDSAEWHYPAVRRLARHVEQSVDSATQFAALEPNDEPLWHKLRGTVEQILDNRYRQGAFQGDRPELAYFVKCDRTTMTQNDIDRGVAVMTIGIAPVKPAEFVIIRIGQWTATGHAFAALPPAAQSSVRDDLAKVAHSLDADVNFPSFVSGLISGTFEAIVDASVEQMQAYGELLRNVADEVDRLVSDSAIEQCERQRRIATMLATGLQHAQDIDQPRTRPEPVSIPAHAPKPAMTKQLFSHHEGQTAEH